MNYSYTYTYIKATLITNQISMSYIKFPIIKDSNHMHSLLDFNPY
jgi:predicted oxidoreductase